MTQKEAFELLAARLEHARREHPVFAVSEDNAIIVISDELEELVHASRHETKDRVISEALDVATTAMRLVMGEVQG